MTLYVNGQASPARRGAARIEHRDRARRRSAECSGRPARRPHLHRRDGRSPDLQGRPSRGADPGRCVGAGPDHAAGRLRQDEKQAGFGFGYFGIIVKSVTIDAWVVISILGVMAVISWYVMWTKAHLCRWRRQGQRRVPRFLPRTWRRSAAAIERPLQSADARRRSSDIPRSIASYHAGAQEMRIAPRSVDR